MKDFEEAHISETDRSLSVLRQGSTGCGNVEFIDELIENLEDGDITFCDHSTFTDLCRGGHIPNTGIIKAVKRGDTGSNVRHRFAQIAAQLHETADVSIIACTELSVLADSLPSDAPTLDALDVLVEEIVALGLGLKTPTTAVTA